VIKKGNQQYCGKITVPFVPESRLSGIERTLQKGETYCYEKSVVLPEGFIKDRVLLHFGAVDQIAKVYLNGQLVGEHLGGYLPFSLDITDFLVSGENVLSVHVTDNLDKTYGYGKQRKNRGGMWYTPISGIWQAVWMESVSEKYIRSLKMTPSLDRVLIETLGGEDEKVLYLQDKEYRFQGNSFTLEIDNPHLWTPEDPYLYDFTLVSGEDKIQSYFALRTITVGEENRIPRLLLNGKPYFLSGLLDQYRIVSGKVICPDCGRFLSEKYPYCPYCGNRVNDLVEGDGYSDVTEEELEDVREIDEL
jgi:beta-galactosidase/beta-glucuronidase